jgi:hypothetical protein
MSTSNQSSVVALDNFFANYDEVLSRATTPIVKSIPSSAVIPSGVTTVYDAQIISYRNVVLGDSVGVNIDAFVVGTMHIDMDQIIIANLMNNKKVDIDSIPWEFRPDPSAII